MHGNGVYIRGERMRWRKQMNGWWLNPDYAVGRDQYSRMGGNLPAKVWEGLCRKLANLIARYLCGMTVC
jgi:hypothetical protein